MLWIDGAYDMVATQKKLNTRAFREQVWAGGYGEL
jgi:hypothetical protein